MSTVGQIKDMLLADRSRFLARGLFGQEGDSLSMSVPGRDQMLLVRDGSGSPETHDMASTGDETARLHTRLYRCRPDSAAVLIGRTSWSEALSRIDAALPVLFDEQARHLGSTGPPVGDDDLAGLVNALAKGANIALFGARRVCLGVTPERVVLNAELFEKCAMAFVIAHCSGGAVRTIPWWIRVIANRRLRRDQTRAADALAAGRIPEGMNAY